MAYWAQSTNLLTHVRIRTHARAHTHTRMHRHTLHHSTRRLSLQKRVQMWRVSVPKHVQMWRQSVLRHMQMWRVSLPKGVPSWRVSLPKCVQSWRLSRRCNCLVTCLNTCSRGECPDVASVPAFRACSRGDCLETFQTWRLSMPKHVQTWRLSRRGDYSDVATVPTLTRAGVARLRTLCY